MWWGGIAFGLLAIAAAVAAWLISGGTADTQALAILVVLGILMIVLTVVKVHAGRRYFLVMTVLGAGGMVVVGLLGIISGAIPEEGGLPYHRRIYHGIHWRSLACTLRGQTDR